MPVLSYSELSSGWPTYYTFYPEWMIGVNNNFYSFQDGNLIKHNDVYSPNMYGVAIQSSIVFCANKTPLVNKLFKAISLDASAPSAVNMSSTWANLATQPGGLFQDADGTGEILSSYFVKKESMWFSNISLFAPDSLSYRNMTGMGIASSVTTVGSNSVFIFTTPISETISVGDFYGYVTLPSAVVALQIGTITAISNDRLIVSTANLLSPPVVTDFIFSYKNINAESYGYLASAPIVSLITAVYVPPAFNETKVNEIFSVEFDVMKSFP
jgi:hypothetical protein